MATILLILIYIAFISLGLPDAILGAGWPVMQPELKVPVSFAGLLQIMGSCGTILSSILSARILRRFKTGKTTAVSVALTATGLFGYAFSPSFWWLLLATIPLGIGAGAVDAGLNSYVASHYESRHMSWLHSFWGLGALSGPLVLATLLSGGLPWRSTYLSIAIFQSILVVILSVSIPLWRAVEKKRESTHRHTIGAQHHQPLLQVLRTRGVPYALLTFIAYTGVESTMGLWGGSYLFRVIGLDAADAAFSVSLFYGSITLGRFLTGFATYRVSNNNLIRVGIVVILLGILLFLLPLPLMYTMIGFVLVGLGCAPIFPCMQHAAPERFGSVLFQDVIGLQMAATYSAFLVLPPFFGFIAARFSFRLMPIFLGFYVIVLLVTTEKLRPLKASHEIIW